MAVDFGSISHHLTTIKHCEEKMFDIINNGGSTKELHVLNETMKRADRMVADACYKDSNRIPYYSYYELKMMNKARYKAAKSACIRIRTHYLLLVEKIRLLSSSSSSSS